MCGPLRGLCCVVRIRGISFLRKTANASLVSWLGKLIKAWQAQLLFLMKTQVAQLVKNSPAMQEALV